MFCIPGYHITELLHSGSKTLISRVRQLRA